LAKKNIFGFKMSRPRHKKNRQQKLAVFDGGKSRFLSGYSRLEISSSTIIGHKPTE
jgi:hypothetical protein